MSNTVETVAYGFVGPDAIRIFLELQGYTVNVFIGDPSTLELRRDKPKANVVILPNFAKRGQLAPYADQIGYLVVLTNGHHEPIVEHDIPILDGFVDQQGVLQLGKTKSPQYYIKKMTKMAIALDLGEAAVPQPKKPEPKITAPVDIDQWFTTLEQKCAPALADFERQIEYPVCQYLTGELGRDDFRRAMRALVKAGGDEATVHKFYLWLANNEYADRMAKAMRAYLLPEHIDVAPPATAVAKQFRVAASDVELLEHIYTEMQE